MNTEFRNINERRGGLIGFLSRPVRRSYEWRTDIQAVDNGEYQWQTWTYWCWTWQWCKVGYENIWYDGPNRIFSFGVGTLATCYDSDYHNLKLLSTNRENTHRE